MKTRTSLKITTTLLSLILLACTQQNESSLAKKETMDTTRSEQKNTAGVKTGFAEVNGINMYYEIHGTGKPLVLIHGGGSTIYTSFGKILPLLAKKRQIIAVELQAHGHTSDRNAPESFEQDANDVAQLLKQLNITKADILGFSNGGTTALHIAMQHPEKVNKLIVISAMYKRAGAHNWLWEFMKKGTFNDMPQVYKDAFLSITPDQEKLLNMYHKDHQRMLHFKDSDDKKIAAIQAPTLIVLGDKDVVRPEHALEMAQLMPHSRLAILPGGHGDFIGEIMFVNSPSTLYELTVNLFEEFLDEQVKEN